MSNQRGYSGPEEALAAIAAAEAAAEPQARHAQAWSNEVATIRGVGRADHGDVRATVDVQGLLTGLSVADATAAKGGRAATVAIQRAVREAQESVREQAAASADRAWGPGSPTSQAFRSEVEAATPLVEVLPPESDGRSLPGAGPQAPRGGGVW